MATGEASVSTEVTSEWRAAVGAEVEAESHAIIDVGWRRGPVAIQLFTDTVDLRLGRAWSHGRAEVGLRGAAAAAGLWITPWTDGAPDPSRAQRVAYVGPDAHAERWLPGGWFAGVDGWLRYQWFTPLAGSTLTVDDGPWVRADAVAGGWWGDGRRVVRITGGIDATDRVTPHVTGEGWIRPGGLVAPFGELRVGWADDQDDVVATRLGGLTPYHVPLAGAAWAEFWVEDYAAVRAGLGVHPGILSVAAFADLAVWTAPTRTTGPTDDGEGALGLGMSARVASNGWFVDLAGGLAPGLERQPGVGSGSVYLLAGSDWRPVRRVH